MPKHQIQINSILGGISPTLTLGAEDQYYDAIGIDPEAIGSVGGITAKALGAVMPTFQSTILSNSTLGEAPMWVTGSLQSTGVFVYGSSGSVYALSAAFALDGDGSQWKPTNGAGNGSVAYGDYQYFATPTDIFRLGPLSSTAPVIQIFWTGSAGVAQAALTNTGYPIVNTFTYPNHVMHAHNDGSVYLTDYDSGVGKIRSFSISSAGATSVGTALELPPGLIPTDIKSYGTDLAISCSPATAYGAGTIPKSANSALVLWDTVADSYYRVVTINEALATALVNKNGELHILAGNVDTDVKLLKYLGGESFRVLAVLNEGSPPPACAVDSIGDAVFFGGYVSQPITAGGVFSYGYRSGQLKPALHMPMRISDTLNTLPIVTCLKSIRRSAYPIYGWRTTETATFGLEQISSTGTQASRWRTKVYNIGKRFRITRIRIPMVVAVATGDSVSIRVLVDSGSVATTGLKTLNATNFPNSERICDFNFVAGVVGYSNFYIQFTFEGTNRQGFSFPITIDYETDEL